MAIHGYDNIKQKILDDFNRQTDGLEKLFSTILNDKMKDVDVNSNVMRKNIQQAVNRAIRDVKGDTIGKIKLTDFIDMDTKGLQKTIKSMFDEYINDATKAESPQYIRKMIAATQVASKRGVQFDVPDINMKQLKIDSNFTSKLESQINDRLAKVGVNKATEEINNIISKINVGELTKYIEDEIAKFDKLKIKPIAVDTDSQQQVKEAFKETVQEANKAGDAIEKAAKDATAATDALAKKQDEVIEKQKELEKVGGNKYADILNKSYETKDKKQAYKQLKEAYDEYQKFFGDKGIDKDKIIRNMSDAGREAGYNYINAWQEAVNKGVAQTRIEKNTVKDIVGSDEEFTAQNKKAYSDYIYEQARMLQELGNPQMTDGITAALNEYMERWDLLRAHQKNYSGLFDESDIKNDIDLLNISKQKLAEVITAKQHATESSSAAEQAQTEAEAHKQNEKAIKDETAAKEEQTSQADNSQAIENTKAEKQAHEGNTEAIKNETEAKLEQKATDNSQTITQVNNEKQAHVENKQAIQEETKAKKESQSSPTSEADVEHLNKLKKAAEDAKKKYNELIAKKNELLLEQASLMNGIENTAAKDGYDLAMDNARQYSLDPNKLYGLALEKSKKGSKGDVEQLGKAAAYYQLYIEALKNTDEEIKKVTVNGTDLSKKLIELAQSFGSIGSDTNTLDRLKAVNKELTAIGKQETSAKKASDKALRDYTTELNKNPVKVPITLEMSPEDEAAQNARLSTLADMLFGGTSEKAQEAAASIGEVTNKLEEQKAATETAVNAEEKLAESAQKVTEAKKEEQAVTDSSAEVANAEKAAEAEKAKAEATKEATEAKQEEKALSDSTEEVANTEKAVEAEKAKVEATRESVEAKKEEKAVTDTTVETANAEKQAVAKKEEATAIHEVTDAKKEEQAVTANTQDVSVTEAKTEKLREQEAAVQGVIEAEREMAAPIATQEAQDYSALSEQLNNILQLIAKKNELFQTEATIVTSTANTESEALLNIAIALEQINGYLANISDKNINVSIKGLNSLTKLDIDKLDERLMKAWDSLDTFARGVSEIKIDDSNIVSAINNLLKDGEKLKNLATIVSSSKKDILGAANTAMNATPNATGSAPNAKPDENIALAYQNALNSAERFYELRHMNRELTEEETKELERLWTTWDNLGKELNANIQKLEQMGKSTKNAYGFMKQYNDDSGYKAYVEKLETAQAKGKPKEDLGKPYKEAMDDVQRYYQLLLKSQHLNSEEAAELRKIEDEWQKLYTNVNNVTQAIEAQGKSTKALKSFTEMYTNRAGSGLEEYVKGELDKAKLGNITKWIDDNIFAKSQVGKRSQNVIDFAQELKNTIKGITVTKIIDDGVFPNIDKVKSDFTTLVDMTKQLQEKMVNPLKVFNLADEIDKYLKQYTALPAKFTNPLQEYVKELKGSNGEMLVSRYNEISNSFKQIKVEARNAGKETKSFWTKMGESVSHANAQMIGMYFSFYRIIGYIRQMTQEVIKLDSALTELRKITNISTTRLDESFERSTQTAKALGSTIDAVISQTSDWSRLGYSIEDAEKLARVSTLFQTVGDNMTAESASKAMISTLKGFDLAADAAESVVDRYVEIANNFSIDTAGISEAIEKSGASLNAAGNNLNESLGMIVAGNAALQNPNTVGTMLKTFAMRLRGATASELEELGIDTTGMSNAKKSVVKQFKAMAGIDIMEGKNYKSTFQILDELHEKWNDLSDAEQAALTEAVGGKRGGTVMASLMQNWEDAKAVVEKAIQSEGTAEDRMSLVMESAQAKLNTFKASIQELDHDIVNSKGLKNLIDLGTKFINILDQILKKTGGLSTAVGVGAGIFAVKNGFNLKDTYSSFANISTQIANYNKLTNATSAEAVRFAKEIGNGNVALRGYLSTVQTGQASLAGFGQYLANVTLKEKAAALGATLLSGAFQAITSIGISLVITAVISKLTQLAQAEDEARENAARLANEYADSSKELDDYVEKYKELNKKLEEAGEDEEAVRSIKEQLVGIQQNLNDKYGDEYNKVNLVNGKYQDQLNILLGIKKAKAEDIKSKNANAYNKAVEDLSTPKIYRFKLTREQEKAGLGTWLDEQSEYLYPKAENVEEPNAAAEIVLSADIENADEVMKAVYSELEKYGKEHSIDVSNILGSISKYRTQIDANEKFKENKAVVEETVPALIVANDELNKAYENGIEAVNKYNQALASKEGIEEAESNLNKVKNSINSIEFDDIYIEKQFSKIWDGIDVTAEKRHQLDKGFEGILTKPLQKEGQNAKKQAEEINKELASEYKKLENWLPTYADDVKQGNVQHKFGNVDMDKRSIIKYDEELLEKYKQGMSSWEQEFDDRGNLISSYYSAIAEDVKEGYEHIDTVFGGSTTVAAGNKEFDVSFTPIMLDENGENPQFLTKATVEKYVQRVIGEADEAIRESGENYSLENVYKKALAIDLAGLSDATTFDEYGKENGKAYIHGLISGINDYTGEGGAKINANDVGILTHFVGDFGALNLAQPKEQQKDKEPWHTPRGLSELTERIREAKLSEEDFADGFDSLPSKVEGSIKAILMHFGYTEDDLDLLKEKLIELGVVASNSGEEAQEEINKSVPAADFADQLVADYEKAFKAVGAAYKDMVEKDFDVKQLDLSSLTAIKSELTGMNDKGIEVDTSGYEKLLATLTNVKSTEAEIKDAFSNMASTLVNSITKIDEGNVEVAESFLRSNGVVDASLGSFMAYCNSLDETAAKSKGLIDANGNIIQSAVGISSSADNASSALVEEMYSGENTTNALKYLQLSMIAVASQGIDVSGQIDSLKSLAGAAIAAGVAVRQATGLQNASKELERAEAVHGKDSAYYKAVLGMTERKKGALEEEVNKELKNLQNGLTIDLSKVGGGGSGSGKGKGGGGGGGSKKEKEEEVDVLKELSAQLDEIQAAYASLTEITEKYNETGKLTVDQAQELINTDFHFLAMLKEENGQLKLNEQGMQDLAKAKITEMQIQLARNAIDTVNKLQTEADAINFLKYAYEGLAGATLDATEAQLRMAVAAAKARGEAQGSAEMVKAAESIYQGYLATKQAIGNTDFSKESLKGDQKDKTKETKDKDKDKDKEEKEETKTRFNWLEQLVNNIQRTIDRLAKRAEKYFSYMEKNAMVDKQIAANRRMINTQEVASAYYSSKAGKALKKVPKKYRKLVSGDFDAATVKKLYADVGEKGTEKLNTYLDWKTLRDESQDKLADAYDRERELIASKMDNILSYFDTLIGYQQNIVSGIEASMKLDTAKGLKTDINKIIAAYGEEKDIVEKSAEREEAYRQEAASNTEAIRKSYNSQIDQTQTGYQNTTDYQKLKNKGKQGKAKSTIQGGYEVLEEDITEAIAAAKKLNSKKSSKQAEGRAVLERLHQKYVDRITELQREADEVEKANQEKLADQIEQNKTMTKEAEIAKWERMKSVLEEMGKVYDSQISQLGTLIDKYETLADLLKSVDASTIAKYNVNDIFGLTGDEDSDRKSFIQKSIDSTKSMIEEYKKQYALYGDIVNAMESSAADRQQKFLDILKKNNLDESSKKIVEDLAKELAGNNWEGNEYLEQYKQMMSEIVSSIAKSIKQIEDYSDELADSVTEATQKIIDALKLLQDAYASKASLINDSWVVDINGITKFGYAKVSALSQEMNIARQRADQFRQQITDIENAGVNAYGSQDEYDEARNTAIKNYYEALQNAYSVQNEIYEIAKKAAQVEIDNVSKLVENYKKALNSKKAYYDYDKTLREKNKNIQALEAEMKALENVGDAASKARLKAIQAELKEAQEDLDDTVFEHSIQVETDALDKLIEDMTNALDNSAKTIQETFEEFARTVSAILSASSGVSSDAVYNDLIGFIMNGKTTGVISGSVGSVGKSTSNSSTVAGDMKDGTLTSLNEKSLSNINTNVLNILSKQRELTALQSKISSANNSLPNIANQVTKISTNVETIAKNTTSMAKGIEALNQSNQQLQALIPMMKRPGEWNEIFDQLKRRGIIRYYY